jgi:hypothetical protein
VIHTRPANGTLHTHRGVARHLCYPFRVSSLSRRYTRRWGGDGNDTQQTLGASAHQSLPCISRQEKDRDRQCGPTSLWNAVAFSRTAANSKSLQELSCPVSSCWLRAGQSNSLARLISVSRGSRLRELLILDPPGFLRLPSRCSHKEFYFLFFSLTFCQPHFRPCSALPTPDPCCTNFSSMMVASG